MSHMYPHVNNPNSGTFVHEQVVELQQQGIDVVVLCTLTKSTKLLSYLSRKWKNYYEQPSFVELDKVPVYFDNYFVIPRNVMYHTSGDRMFKGILETVKILHKKHQFDLIHAHVALPDGYAALKVGEILKLPVVTTIHGQDVQTVIHKSNQCREKVKFVIENSDATVFVSTKLLRIKELELNTTKDRSVVIHNGLPKLFSSSLSEKILKESQKCIQLVSISNLKRTKGLGFNLKALGELKREGYSFHYSIVGVGEELENLKKIVIDYDLIENVSFLGQLSRQEILNQLRRSAIFTMPSWQEGFGMVYLEAMSQGIPIIACKGEGIEDVVKDKVNGFLVEPKDVLGLKKILAQLMSDSQLRSRIGANAKLSVEKDFTLCQVVTQLRELYTSVLIGYRG